MTVLGAVLLLLLAGSLVYAVMTIVAAWLYLKQRPGELREPAPISVLRPLSGVDDGLEENLRSLFSLLVQRVNNSRPPRFHRHSRLPNLPSMLLSLYAKKG